MLGQENVFERLKNTFGETIQGVSVRSYGTIKIEFTIYVNYEDYIADVLSEDITIEEVFNKAIEDSEVKYYYKNIEMKIDKYGINSYKIHKQSLWALAA